MFEFYEYKEYGESFATCMRSLGHQTIDHQIRTFFQYIYGYV